MSVRLIELQLKSGKEQYDVLVFCPVSSYEYNMNFQRKCIGAAMSAVLLTSTVLTGCGMNGNPASQANAKNVNASTIRTTASPKYVFLFIGDGMRYPQIQLTNYFQSVKKASQTGQTVNVDGKNKTVVKSENNLHMIDFPVEGTVQTFDSTSFAPDSASTATSTHILNNKSGINFGSYSHTGLPVAVFAKRVGQDEFDGYYDNTNIYNKMAQLTGVK